jgi:hypothetical protein
MLPPGRRRAALVRLLPAVPCLLLGVAALWVAGQFGLVARTRLAALSRESGCQVSGLALAPLRSVTLPNHSSQTGWCARELAVVVASWEKTIRRGHINWLAVTSESGVDSLALEARVEVVTHVGDSIIVLREMPPGAGPRRGTVIAFAVHRQVYETQAHPAHDTRRAAGFLLAAILAFGAAALIVVLRS